MRPRICASYPDQECNQDNHQPHYGLDSPGSTSAFLTTYAEEVPDDRSDGDRDYGMGTREAVA